MSQENKNSETVVPETITTHDGRVLTPLQVMREVKAHILLEPEAYAQSDVCYGDKPTCETPACIAGWMSHVVNGKQGNGYYEIHEKVFGSRVWPWLFNSHWVGGNEPQEIEGKEPTPENACRAIDLYLEEKGIL